MVAVGKTGVIETTSIILTAARVGCQASGALSFVLRLRNRPHQMQ